MAGESLTGVPAEATKEVLVDQPASLDNLDDAELDEALGVEGDIDATETEDPSADGARPLVFISYRHGSDQPIASALKLLVERTIAPRPQVFVASEGGIQPSTLGIKSQLQKAVKEASAFIGVITQASKDREWLYFEAGAAWGLEKLYAPLLLDASAADLSTTIADLHATNARSQDQVRRMLGAIATAIGGRLRDRFGPRYASFERSFHPDVSVRKRVDGTTPGQHEQIAEIVALHRAGKTAEADALMAGLEARALDIDAKAWIRILIIMDTKQSSFEKLQQLEQLPEEYARAPSYSLWRAILETSSQTALACLRQVIADPESSQLLRRMATNELAVQLYEIRRNDEAAALLVTSLTSADREIRRDAAETWCNYEKSAPALLRMAMAGFGMRAHPSLDLLTQQVGIGVDEGWLPLAVYCAESADALAKTGTTANDQGRAYAKAALWSLAYEAYQRAVALGVSVARSNIASIVGHHAVAAVGIQLLEQHQGPFDSAVPASPYQIRAELVQVIHEERLRRDRLYRSGELLNRLLVDLMELAIRSQVVAPQATYIIDGQPFQAARRAADLVLKLVSSTVPISTPDATEMTAPVLPSNIILPPMQSTAPTALLGALAAGPLTGMPSIALMPGQQTVPVPDLAVHAATQLAPRHAVVLSSIYDRIPIWQTTLNERIYLLTLDETGDLIGFSLTKLTDDDPDPRPLRFEARAS